MCTLCSTYNIHYISDMANTTKEKLLKERAELLSEMGRLSQLLHGTWVERYSVCSRPSCQCHNGQRHGPRHYLVVNEKGRQRQKYVSNSQIEVAQAGLAQHRRLQEIVGRITHLNLTLMKEAET
jgi:hypothetical protein